MKRIGQARNSRSNAHKRLITSGNKIKVIISQVLSLTSMRAVSPTTPFIPSPLSSTNTDEDEDEEECFPFFFPIGTISVLVDEVVEEVVEEVVSPIASVSAS